MRLSRIQPLSGLRAVNVALLSLFIFCQVSGFMCMAPDVSLGGGYSLLPVRTHVCPMESSITCPTSLTASPQRQTNTASTVSVDVLDQGEGVVGSGFSQLYSSTPTSFPRSSVSSLVPSPTRSVSVLRI